LGKHAHSFWTGAVALGLALGAAACSPRPNDEAANSAPAAPPLIPRTDLFGDAVRAKPSLSPRGDMIAFLAPRDGALNVFVVPVGTLGQARPLTDDQSRGVHSFTWAPDGANLLYFQDANGDENWRLYAADVVTGQSRALTPPGTRAKLIGVSGNDPGGVVAMINDRDRNWPDVYRIDLGSGERTLLYRNEDTPDSRGFAYFVVDRENRLRLGIKGLEDGGMEVFSREVDESWRSLFVIPFEDAMQSQPLGFEAGGRTFLMFDSTGRDRAALVRVDAVSGAKTVLGESPRADVIDVWLDPASNMPEAFAADYLRRDWRALDSEAQADLDFLDTQLPGEPDVVSRSLNDQRWIVVEHGPTTPARSYLYDRSDLANRRLTLLFRHRPDLELSPMQSMIPYEIEARDGLTLVSYLTLPIGSDANNDSVPDAPAPLVLVVHGGPWERDSYGFNSVHQWLANRGYAALSVNYRGSSGFGKAFLNAGNRQWGGAMQDDLIDAVDWAVARGVTQPDRVAILGGSYGGFAALYGLAATPQRFACGVSLSGVANLSSLIETVPQQWRAYRDEMYLRVGDPRTLDGRQMLRERSPVTRVSAIERPLLMAIGARDPYVSRADHDAIAQNLRARRKPFVYLVYPQEGHHLARPSSRLSFYATAEHFLGECLGGRVEPVGAAFDGALLEAMDGADSVPGLSAFRRRPAPAASAAASDGASLQSLPSDVRVVDGAVIVEPLAAPIVEPADTP